MQMEQSSTKAELEHLNTMIDVTINDNIAQLTLNRPERRNALGTELIRAFAEELRDLRDKQDVRVVIVHGAESVFCAGSDLKELALLEAEGMVSHEAETAEVVRGLTEFPKPTIAAIEGYALGGGFALAIACDIVVASSSALLAMPEAANGWCPPWGLTPLTRRCSITNAQRVVWGHQPFSVSELKEIGIVDHAITPGRALEKANELAASLAKLPYEAVLSVKDFFRTDTAGLVQDDARCSHHFLSNCASEEAQRTFHKFRKKHTS